MAYCLDSAVAEFGTSVQAALDEVTGKNPHIVAAQKKTLLARLLGDEPPTSAFRNPTPTTD